MDSRTGQLLTEDKYQSFGKTIQERFLKRITIPLTAKQLRRNKIGRNDPCPCGSGEKFKRCCFRPQQKGG